MQKPTMLHIPMPCHENWNTMTATEQGKLCAACSKQVIDFTMMSDQQILNVLAQQKGKLCGRFYNDQLERQIVETKVKKIKSLWLAFTLPFIILFQKSFGQKIDSAKAEAPQTLTENRILMGEPLMVHSGEPIAKEKMLHGTVVDEHNQALQGASVIVKGTQLGVATDSNGRFNLRLPKEEPIIIEVSYVGYKTMEKQIDTATDINCIKIPLTMEEVVTMGLVAITHISRKNKKECRKITVTEKADSTTKKMSKVSPFSISPNPVSKGNFIFINFKQEGSYELQLLSNESRLIKAEKFNTSQTNIPMSFPIPSTISTGIYYLLIININTRKSYTEKLLIQ